MQISETTRDEAFRLFGRLVARSDPGRLEAWADLGLTMTQLRLLFLLRTADGLSAGTIADQLGVTPSTLTRIRTASCAMTSCAVKQTATTAGSSAIISRPRREGLSRRWSVSDARAWTASSPGLRL